MVDPAGPVEKNQDPAYLPGTDWRVWHAGLVVFVFLASAVVGLLVFALLTGRPDEMSANEQLGILGPVQFLGGAAGLLLVLRLYQQGMGPVRAFGLRLRLTDQLRSPSAGGRRSHARSQRLGNRRRLCHRCCAGAHLR